MDDDAVSARDWHAEADGQLQLRATKGNHRSVPKGVLQHLEKQHFSSTNNPSDRSLDGRAGPCGRCVHDTHVSNSALLNAEGHIAGAAPHHQHRKERSDMFVAKAKKKVYLARHREMDRTMEAWAQSIAWKRPATRKKLPHENPRNFAVLGKEVLGEVSHMAKVANLAKGHEVKDCIADLRQRLRDVASKEEVHANSFAPKSCKLVSICVKKAAWVVKL